MLRRFIENHFGFVLILACVAGLVVPGMPDLPNESAIAALAALMFLSCYKLKDGGFSGVRWRGVAVFYLARYVLLPPLLWWLTMQIAPGYAVSVFLLSVIPAAVSSPAFTAIYGGAVPSAFAIVIVSQILTPVVIPLEFMLIGGEHVTPSPAHLFATLVLCILLPMALYALVKNHQKSAVYFYAQGKYFSIWLIAFVIALAVAKQRDVILADPPGLVLPLFIALLCYVAYIAFGWALAARQPRTERIAYATCSGFNNAALAVSLALLHFPPPVVLFMAASEIGWALLPMIMKFALRFFPR